MRLMSSCLMATRLPQVMVRMASTATKGIQPLASGTSAQRKTLIRATTPSPLLTPPKKLATVSGEPV